MIRVKRIGAISDAIQIGKDAGEEIRSIAGPRFIEYQEAFLIAQT